MTVPTDIPLGTRVVVRHRLPPGYSHPMTDVIGVLEAHEPVTVRTADDRTVQIAADRIVAVKALGARPVRTGEIRSLEVAAALGWPGVESAWIGGWLARFGHGITGRANSAAPLGMPGELAPFEEVADELRAWYSVRGQPLRLLLPDRLTSGSLPRPRDTDPVSVLAADIGDLVLPTGPAVSRVEAEPDSEWLARYPFRTGRRSAEIQVLSAIRGGELGFARIGNAGAPPIAIGRAAITRAPDGRVWVGLSCVEVAAEHRRHGVGSLVCAEMIAWGRERGATHTYLQVTDDNSSALAMYRKLGLVEHHRYRYAVPAAVDGRGDVE